MKRIENQTAEEMIGNPPEGDRVPEKNISTLRKVTQSKLTACLAVGIALLTVYKKFPEWHRERMKEQGRFSLTDEERAVFTGQARPGVAIPFGTVKSSIQLNAICDVRWNDGIVQTLGSDATLGTDFNVGPYPYTTPPQSLSSDAWVNAMTAEGTVIARKGDILLLPRSKPAIIEYGDSWRWPSDDEARLLFKDKDADEIHVNGNLAVTIKRTITNDQLPSHVPPRKQNSAQLHARISIWNEGAPGESWNKLEEPLYEQATAVALNPREQCIAIACEDALKLYQIREGALALAAEIPLDVGNDGFIHHIAFGKDNTMLAYYGKRKISVLDARTLAEIISADIGLYPHEILSMDERTENGESLWEIRTDKSIIFIDHMLKGVDRLFPYGERVSFDDDER